MRDAFGGAFLIKLLLIFLAIYIAFMAVALNYAKAFRVKNQIINYIEQYEGIDIGNDNDKAALAINNYINNVRYYVETKNANSSIPLDNEEDPINVKRCSELGYCVTEYNSSNNKGTYYLVETYIKFSLFSLDITIPIRGETRVVTKG